MDGLFRRGGTWWARLVVPVRLRKAAGRREFVKSTGTTELVLAKLVGSALLAGWRQKLYAWEVERVDDESLLKLLEGSPALLTGGGFVSVEHAMDMSGLSEALLLRAVAGGRLGLFCRLDQTGVSGFVIAVEELDLIDPALGGDGGYVVPDVRPETARATLYVDKVLRVPDGRAIAAEALDQRLQHVHLVSLEVPGRTDQWFCPDEPLRVAISQLELSTSELEAFRTTVAARVSPERAARARATVAAREVPSAHHGAGKWAGKRFSEALEAYSTDPDGLPGDLRSPHEVRQRKRQMLVFAELMGDLRLADIDGDVLRSYRDGPLKTIPASMNKLPASLRMPTVQATIEALRADGRDWALISPAMQQERMSHLGRFFQWLERKSYLAKDPAAGLRGETGMTKAERRARELATFEENDDEGRRPFTDDELAAIFGQAHFATGHGRDVNWEAGRWYPFMYWLPLLGLYAGLRLKEAAQLHLSDIRQHDDGAWLLSINESTPDKSLKTRQSVRSVPVHPALISLGLLAYCDRLRSRGFKRLFPELSWANTPAKYAKEAGRKMSAMLRDLGMPRDSTRVFHCFRHNCNNALLRAPVELSGGEYLRSYVALRVLGHAAGGNVNREHYTDVTIREMTAVVSASVHAVPRIAPLDVDFAVGCVDVALGRKTDERRGKEDMGPLGLNASYVEWAQSTSS